MLFTIASVKLLSIYTVFVLRIFVKIKHRYTHPLMNINSLSSCTHKHRGHKGLDTILKLDKIGSLPFSLSQSQG